MTIRRPSRSLIFSRFPGTSLPLAFRMKGFHDGNERKSVKVFQTSCGDASISTSERSRLTYPTPPSSFARDTIRRHRPLVLPLVAAVAVTLVSIMVQARRRSLSPALA